MANKDSKSLASSIGSYLFKKMHARSVQDRRGSTDSTGFQVRSKSLENLGDVARDIPPTISELKLTEHWSELALLKSQGTHIVCILPSSSLDFVISCLYAIGVNPLVPEDPSDVEGLLINCKGVIVDVSAREVFLEALTEHHIGGAVPLVMIATNSGTDDKRKKWARKIIEKCEPSLVSGYSGDIHALSQDITERVDGILEEDEDIDAVIKSISPAPGALPRSKSPNPGHKSPPLGRKSPVGRNLDIGKKLLGRTNTAIPHMVMKGQFRHQTVKDLPPQVALESGRQLAAYCKCYVHLFEASTVTCGEFFIQVSNFQMGIEYLHSVVQSAVAITTSVLACVEEEGQEISLLHCAHGLSYFSVAVERAGFDATANVELPQPGTLRTCFIDRLYQLSEVEVRLHSSIVKHNLAPCSTKLNDTN